MSAATWDTQTTMNKLLAGVLDQVRMVAVG